jgi:hypothetical protein
VRAARPRCWARPLTFARRRVSEATTADVFFGKVPREHWVQPDWINETLATKNREEMDSDVPYARAC